MRWTSAERLKGEIDMRFLKHLLRLLGEFWGYAWRHKAWWVIPIVILLLIITILIVSFSHVAPFIYPAA